MTPLGRLVIYTLVYYKTFENANKTKRVAIERCDNITQADAMEYTRAFKQGQENPQDFIAFWTYSIAF